MITRINRLRTNLIAAAHQYLASRCIYCDAPDALCGICRFCRDVLPWNDVYCERCGRPLPSRQPPGVCCADCQRRPPPYDRARAVFVYQYPVDRVLTAIKFKRQLGYLPGITDSLAGLFVREFPHCDALLPVPLHRWRQMTRGFNQAVELCRPLSRRFGQRILMDVSRSKATQPQSGLSAADRRRNLHDAFQPPELLRCRHPVIVDDVITTGATVAQLSRILRRAGAQSIGVLAVATAQ